MKASFLPIALLLTLGLLPATSFADRGEAEITTVTTPPPLDAKDEAWPDAPVYKLSGPDGSAEFQILADADNFYVRVRVEDESPLKNSASRPEEALKGGDAIAIYFGGEKGSEQRVLLTRRQGRTEVFAHRPQSRAQRPYTFSSPVGEAEFDFVGPIRDAEAKFRTGEDYYIAEVALPWRALGMQPPPARFPFELKVIFSDPSGTTNASMAWWHSRGSPGDTVEDLPTEARLYPDTWGVAAFEPSVAATVDTAPVPGPGVPIEFELPRDGRVSMLIVDSDGWIVRELLTAEAYEEGTHTVEWDGRDRYGEPLPPGDYAWRALLFDGMGTEFMGSVGQSGRPPFRTPDRLGSMGGQHGVPTALAADKDGIYKASGLEEGWPALRKIKADTGEAIWTRSAGGFGAIRAVAADEGLACIANMTGRGDNRGVDVVRIDPETGQDVAMGDSPARVRIEGVKEELIRGMAIANKRAYFSVQEQNRIGGMDLQTGKALPDITIEEPTGLARVDESHLLVCTGSEVIKLNVDTGKRSVVLKGLNQARAVALDEDGNFYVSDLGDSQQIKKFDPKGKLIATWGLAGGKPPTMNPYDPMAFRSVNALAIGPDGNLWMSEADSTPKRFVKLTTDGKWLEDFYGPVAYNTFGPDLDDFSVVYYNSAPKHSTKIIETKVDYAQYKANPRDPAAAWQVTAIHDLSLGADGESVNEVMGDVAKTGYGHIFSFTGANGKKYLFRPSKHNRATVPPGAGLWLYEDEQWVPVALLSRDEEKNPSWLDLNGDGLMQEDEFFTGVPTREFAWIDPDLTLHGEFGKLSPASIDERGVPDYRGGKFEPYLKEDLTQVPGGWTFFSPQLDGATYYVANIGPHRWMSHWDRATENQLIKVADGEVEWLIGQNHPRPLSTEMSTASGVAGVVDDVVIVHIVEPALYIAYTTDGFTLGNAIVDERGRRPSTGPNSITIESFTGLFLKDPESGKPVLFAVSSGDNRILEVTGPGEMTRFDGEVKLESASARQVETKQTVIPYQSWYGNTGRGFGINGFDWEWQPEARGLPVYRNGVLVGDIRLRRDAGSLFVLANVLGSSALDEGEGIELVLAPEKSGDPVSIFLGAKRDEKGDFLPVATLDGEDVVKPPRGGEGDLIEVAVVERWRDLGYRLEAEIPLQLLPQISEERDQKFRRAVERNQIETLEARLPDLKGPVRLRASVLMQDNGELKRYSWPDKGDGVAATP